MQSQGFVNHVLDILASYGNIKGKSMFSGYSLYNDGIIFAIIIDDELYFKADKNLAEEYLKAGSRPFTYRRGEKVISMCYYTVPAEALEDENLMETWFNKTWFIARHSTRKKSKKVATLPAIG